MAWFGLKPSPGPWAHSVYWVINANEPEAGVPHSADKHSVLHLLSPRLRTGGESRVTPTPAASSVFSPSSPRPGISALLASTACKLAHSPGLLGALLCVEGEAEVASVLEMGKLRPGASAGAGEWQSELPFPLKG